MRKYFDIRKLRLYLWIGLAFLLINLMADAAEHGDSTYPKRALDEIWKIIYLIPVNYFLFEFSLPQFSWKRFFRTAAILLMYAFLYSWVFFLWRCIGIALNVYTKLDGPFTTTSIVGDMMGQGMAAIIFFGIIRHFYNHIKLKRSARQLLIEKQQAELNYLKSQTNPHFLFNTLNNIYSLARAKSDLAPESILRLSKILRYMLYETSGPYTAIEQDLKIIGDYIELEKLRYDESLRVNFNYDVEDMKQALPPLLLIPLVENAFKHGVSETRHQPWVDIHLTVKGRQLYFIVKNSTGEPAEEEKVKENIGLSNLRRQLELQYTGYDLVLQQDRFVFTATLKINLASHV